MLSNRSQTEKAMYTMIPFLEHSVKGKSIGLEIRLAVVKVASGGRELLRWSKRELFRMIEIFYILISVVII